MTVVDDIVACANAYAKVYPKAEALFRWDVNKILSETPPDLSGLVTGAEIAKRVGLSPQRIHQLRNQPGFPSPLGRIGQACVWRWETVNDWFTARR